jgi:L-lactate dehydrogenase complex protein LldG
MSSSAARDAILGSIRAALRDVPASEQPADIPVERGYRHSDDAPHAEQVERFIEYTVDYKATVHRISKGELPFQIAMSCAARGVRRLVVPADMQDDWLSELKDTEIVRDAGLSHEKLEQCSGVLTGCALAIAQTGTIVLDGGASQGRRAITLLPDYHLCVVFAEQVVGIVPEAFARLGHTVRQTGRPLTFISGPSATSDIELNRVEGVHGPRTLEVLLIEG